MEFNRHTAIVESCRSPQPTDPRLEKPTTIVVRQPSPRLISNEGPSKLRPIKPVAVVERGPAQPDAIRLPSVTHAPNGIKTAVGVQIAETGNVRRSIGILHRRVGRGDYAVFTPLDPVIKVVTLRSAVNGAGGGARGHGKRLALHQKFVVVLAHYRHLAFDDRHGAAVIEVVHAEICAPRRLRGEITPSNAEIIITRGVHIKGPGALTKNKPSGERTIVQRQVEKFEHRIFVYESHRAIFEFHFRAAVIGGQNIVLANGEI